MEHTDGVVTIRPPVDADCDGLDEAIRSSLDELSRFTPWASPGHDASKTLAWIRSETGTGEDSFLVLSPAGEVVGGCGLNQFSEVNRFANLGYWIRTSRVGNGYATRAMRLLARHGFDHHGLARIEIMMSVENEASRRVAERAGARHEGVLRNRLLLHGRHHDAHLFSLIPGEVGSTG